MCHWFTVPYLCNQSEWHSVFSPQFSPHMHLPPSLLPLHSFFPASPDIWRGTDGDCGRVGQARGSKGDGIFLAPGAWWRVRRKASCPRVEPHPRAETLTRWPTQLRVTCLGHTLCSSHYGTFSAFTSITSMYLWLLPLIWAFHTAEPKQ